MLASDGSWRLTWDHSNWKLTELPMKGKKVLRVADLQNPGQRMQMHSSAFSAENIMRMAHIGPSMTYDQVKDKILAEQTGPSVDLFVSKLTPEQAKNQEWLREVDWSEQKVHYLKVTPENVEPFSVSCKDCVLKTSWTTFSVYSPSSDMQLSDPHYTVMSASAPTAARKLYQMLKVNPDALKNIPWDKLDEFFKANKIGYKTDYSTWS